MLEDADGSLLVVDTGGWYKLCCPTSQLQKPDVLGAIYRVTAARRTTSRRSPGHDALAARTSELARRRRCDELVKLLGDPRPAVQQLRDRIARRTRREGSRASRASRRSPQAIRRSPCGATPSGRSTRIDHPAARALVRDFLWPIPTRPSARPRSIRRASGATAAPFAARSSCSKARSTHNRRAAAEALGRIGDKSAVPALLEAAGAAGDRIARTFAHLRLDRDRRSRGDRRRPDEHERRAPSAPRWSRSTRWTAAGSTRKFVAGLLASADAGAQGDGVVDRRPAPRVGRRAGRRPGRTAGPDRPPGRRAGRAGTAARPVRPGGADPGAPGRPPARRLRPAGRAPEQPAGHGLVGPEGKARARRAGSRRWRACSTATRRTPSWFRWPSRPRAPCRCPRTRPATLPARLLRIAADAKNPAELRLERPRRRARRPGQARSRASSRSCSSQLDRDQPVATRTTAADVLARAKLTPEQLARLADALRTAGPLEVDRLLAAFEQSTDEALGLEAGRRPLRARRPSRACGSTRVKAHLAKYGPAVQKAGRGALRQAQRRRGQAESPARAAHDRRSRRATSAAASSSSTARRPPASPATPSATAAATSAPT